ncbi:ATP-binding protein [Blastococcus saxobsidens]|uniref:Putative transcriptional regulator n=1 Tax=Blastococcus saxobsidens (strain DD2) TaxID=1146883 RepID=H6RIK6_BLASD|nr:ATP-binding protein [Blastococcus saxobsidens]CCG02200.1 putative transcriptional regulator [Blastococcus saxobsidens DD2]
MAGSLSDLFQLTDVTADEFWNLVGKVEHERLDFKARVPKGLSDTLAAMAMTTGGLVVIGIDDDRKFAGAQLEQAVYDGVMTSAHDVEVSVTTHELRVDGVPVVMVGVPAVTGRLVTTPNGRVLRRVGSSNHPLRGDALARFVRAVTLHPREDEPVSGVGVADIDLDALNQLLAAQKRPRVTRRAALKNMAELGLAVERAGQLVPTVAGVVLACVSPDVHIKGARVQFVDRQGAPTRTGASRSRHTLSAPLSRLVEELVALIENAGERHEAVVGLRREVIPTFPREVLREALLNALAHRDYQLSGGTVDVTLFSDRLEVRSPGGLAGHVTLENLRDEHFSRNSRLMGALKSLELVDEFGEGVDRMYEGMAGRLLPDPTWSATDASVTVTLRSESPVSLDDQVWLSMLSATQMTTDERRVLVLARHEGRVTRRSVRALLGPDVDVPSLLRGMFFKALLVQVGERGGTYYELSREIVARVGSYGIAAQARRREQLVDLVQSRRRLSVAEAADELHVPREIVKGLLVDLTSEGLVRAVGNTRARVYVPAADS